jgi:hypothetical protein
VQQIRISCSARVRARQLEFSLPEVEQSAKIPRLLVLRLVQGVCWGECEGLQTTVGPRSHIN